MYEVTNFRKILNVEEGRGYGTIIVYFGSKTSFKRFPQISLTKFNALSHILENDRVGYDNNDKVFRTQVESTDFVVAPQNEIL